MGLGLGGNSNYVKQLIIITAMRIAESWSTLSFTNKLFFAALLRDTRQDHEKQEALAKKSSLD